MRRLLVCAAAIVCPTLALAVIVGCGSNPTKDDGKVENAEKKTKEKATVLEGEYTGTITGKVTFQGDMPPLAKLTEEIQAQMKAKDEIHCLTDVKPEDKDQTEQQNWRIDKGAVFNVFVWIAPPKGKFFHVDPAKKSWEDEVNIDQPHCAFTPHVVVTFPYYKDDKGNKVETKQKFQVKNSSKALNHNTNVTGGVNQTIPAGGTPLNVVLEPSSKPVFIKCDIHTWMNAYAGVFDHPYATTTKKDGTYEIKNVPVGAEVLIYAWHEKGDYLNAEGAKGEKIKLEAKTPKDFTIEYKP
jgi:hypothetical protein